MHDVTIKVTGATGSGKSTILKVIQAALLLRGYKLNIEADCDMTLLLNHELIVINPTHKA